MKVLISIDSFKGSISSIEGSQAIALGVTDVYPDSEIVAIPLADGGEGTVEALIHATDGKIISLPVTGPLNEKVTANYGILGDGKTAVIEVAAACGLPLVPIEKRNPKVTTTYGVGELILDAIEKGCLNFVIGLGGSATNDAGVGMLQALGFRFLNKDNEEVGFGGQVLKSIESVEIQSVHPILKQCTFQIACDVNNPLFGPNGATYIYGPQKGATPEMLEELDEGLKHFSEVVERDMNIDLYSQSGTGAAGGLGAAFVGFLNGTLHSGIDLILETVGMEAHLEDVDFVITGEGKLDGQTSMGKAPLGIAKMADRKGIPVIALAGAFTKETAILNDLGITSYFSIVNEPMTLQEAMNPSKSFENLRTTTKQLFRLIERLKG